MSQVDFDSIPEWEAEALLSMEADPLVELSLEIVDRLSFEQQLALLDKLGIGYQHLLDKPDQEPVVEEVPEVIEFADLF